jgi:hypothetical protein
MRMRPATASLAFVSLIACGREAARPDSAGAPGSPGAASAAAAGSVSAAPGTDTSTRAVANASTDSLVAAFRNAHERRDVPALLALFQADCATPEMRALSEKSLRSHLDDPIQAARVEPPLPTRVKSYEREGKRYELSVPLEGELVVVYDTATGRRSSYPLGSVGGVARLGTMCAR